MAVTTNEGKPASDSVSTLISGINMVFTASASATSNVHGKIVKVMLYVLFILILAAYRLKNRNSTCYNIAEALGFLLGLALILIVEWTDATTYWIGSVTWVIFCAWEAYSVCKIFRYGFCRYGIRIAKQAYGKAAEEIGRLHLEEANGNHGLTQRRPKV